MIIDRLFRSLGADRLGIAFAILIATLVASCSSAPLSSMITSSSLSNKKAPPPAAIPVQPRPAKIAMLLPLGSQDASAPIAKAMKQAGEMALFDFNNPMIQLVVKDDRGTLDGAQAAAQEAVRDGAEIILGPLHARSIAGAAPVSRASNVPMISFANDRMAAGNGVYLLTFMAEQEVDRIVSFAMSRGKRRFAALIPSDAYGAVVEPAFRRALQKHGGTLVTLANYEPKPETMVEPVKRVLAEMRAAAQVEPPVDALFVPAGPDVVPHIGPLLMYSGFDKSRVQLIGTGAWDYLAMRSETAFAGGWYPSADPGGFKSFSERFTRTFGYAPPRMATLSYDAVAMSIILAANPPGQRYTAENLMRPAGFNGTDGLVRFAANGACERALAVLEVRQSGNWIIDAAPIAGKTPVAAWTSEVVPR